MGLPQQPQVQGQGQQSPQVQVQPQQQPVQNQTFGK